MKAAYGLGVFILVASEAQAAPLSLPAIAGPLSANPNPISFDAGPPGNIYVTGAVSGLAFWQDDHVPGDHESRIDLDNGQVFVQKTDGWLQFFVQAGVYSLPSLGTGYLKTGSTPNATYGVVPQAFVKIVPSDGFSIEAGKLPTLIGDEYTFSFENMNIERGLLWNQEPAVSRGVQANYSSGPLSLALSWNDGFYSNTYNWLSGSIGYTIDGANSLSLIGGGNLGRTRHTNFATPLAQNNGEIYNLIYTHTSGPWTISPYIQYSRVRRDAALGIAHDASTFGAAVLASYAFDDSWKLAGRGEYIDSSATAVPGAPNLLYGQGSKAWSFTITPTYQNGIFFARAEASYVSAASVAPGAAFGANDNDKSQSRIMFETGMLY